MSAPIAGEGARSLDSSGARRRRPRLGFLGVGWIGRSRLEAVAEDGSAEVAAVADANVERARDALAWVPGAAVERDLEALLRHDLDGIVIATPSALHADQAIAVLERGLAVFSQKPLGRDAAETSSVVEAARRADRLLGVDFCYRHVAGMERVRELVRQGKLGAVYAVDAVFHNAYGPDKPWFYDPEQSGGGCLMDLGIHLVDLATWLLGHPSVVRASGRLYRGGEPFRGEGVEDYAIAELLLRGGGLVRIACSWNLDAGRDAVIAVDLYGTRGGAALRNVDGSFYDFTVERYRRTAREVLASPPDAWSGRAVTAWARRLARSRAFDPEAERVVEVARILDAIYAGADRAAETLARGAGSSAGAASSRR